MTSALAETLPSRRRPSAVRRAADALRGRTEFGDALLFFYALVLVRQYLWVVGNNALAWSLSVALASVACYFYVRTKPFKAERVGREFWIVVALPLLFIYLLRVPFPDVSFDVLNYHLLHSERSLRGTLFVPGDYFPTPAPYNPAPDTLTGLFRLALGYRLGTIVNLLALVWGAQVVDKLLRPFITSARARSVCVLLVALAEQLLFEVNNYMVDLLALPLLLEATRLALLAATGDAPRSGESERATLAGEAKSESFEARDKSEETEGKPGIYVHGALLLGGAAALKLTNMPAVLAVVLLFAYAATFGPRRLAPRRLAATLASCFVAFVVPLLPFSIYLWSLTGNPLFPFANTLFKSPYWHTNGGWDMRWGPKGVWETLAWPVVVAFEPERHSELAVYSGRVSIGFAVALACLAVVWRDAHARTLLLLFIAACLLWSAGGMGYSRYGLYIDLLAGVVVLAVASVLLRREPRGINLRRVWWRTALASVLVAALVAQGMLACFYVCGYEWSMRPTLFAKWRAYRSEAKYILRDRTLKGFLDEGERARYAAVPAWVESGIKTNGIESLLNPGVPAVTVSHAEFFATRDARRRFVQTVETEPGTLMYSLCFPEDLAAAKEFIKARGLEVGRVTSVEVPFFSPSNRIGMMFVEVARPQATQARAAFEASWMDAAFPDEDYRAQITAEDQPATLHAGEKTTLRLRVRNLGRSTWPAHGDAHGMFQVNAGDRWLDSEGERVVNDLDGRTALQTDLAPGGEAELALAVNAPKEPGVYVLEIDMIHEGVTFFHERGSTPLRMRVRVEP